MKNFNIVKLDSKGRIIIPYHIREYLDLKESQEFIIINKEKKELKIIPLVRGKTADIRVLMNDIPGSLARVTSSLAKHNIDIMMSQSKTVEKGELAEWYAIVDISECKNFKKIMNDLTHLKNVKRVEVRER